MNESWYAVVSAETPLTQGDFMLDCPLLAWSGEDAALSFDPVDGFFRAATRAIRADVVVMTQACDLEQNKVSEIILCPQLPVSEYRTYWREEMLAKSQNPTEKAWRILLQENICEGFVWNLTMLNAGEADG